MKNDYYKYIKGNIRIQEICKKLGIPVHGQGSMDMCRCPFHDDHTPSMVIYEDHAYCYACKKRWDNLDFVGEHLDLDFDGRIEWMEKNFPEILSKKPELIENEERAITKNGYEVAYEVYADMTAEEDKALQQFADNRKFEKAFLEKQGIFFARGRKLQSVYVQGEDVYIEERARLAKCQLLLRQPWHERSLTDRYADYYSGDGVMIPVRDRKKNIVGFAQRTSENRQPKYKFTKGLPKKTILYRIDEFERRIQAEKKEKKIELYLVEGIFDALRLETGGKHALAVLGSQLTKTQTAELESILQEYHRPVSIHIFMDKDEAGEKGNLQTLRNLWSREFFRKNYIDILIPLEGKDPDQCLREGQNKKIKKYSPFEYLIHSNLPDEEMEKEETDTRNCFESLATEDKIICLSKINHWLPGLYWKDIFGVYAIEKDDYFAQKISAYMGGRGAQSSRILPERKESYQFQAALQIARIPLENEALPLDELSWDRIQACADVFFAYFKEILQEGKTIRIPLLSMRFPKKLNEERTKSIYVHERLILQQYVLNEMLGEGDNGYASYIPAVRYDRQSNRIYTTAENTDRETVSFAYQIDMDVLLRSGGTKKGMFRDYYGCWKAYIQYIQEGIQKIASNRIYRIKLDIRKYYDSIPQYAARKGIFPALLKGLRADPDKFSAFQPETGKQDANSLAEKVTSWILGELYESRYYDSENGRAVEKEDITTGIPQGPNLSAYIANIVLFEMDWKILQLVDSVNESASEGNIIIRYARYVDDMIIISSDADALLEVKSLISSELYELGLVLSSKTDREDGVSKEEAIAWTTDQRGGLGVSAVSDFPDDTLDDVLEELDSYEVTDRRSALKLLKSALLAVDKEDFLEQTDQNRLLSILFQTQEIRFVDIVRIAELLLIKAARQNEIAPEKNIYDTFMELWTAGRKSSPKDSLFWEEGIDIYAFLEGCNKVLIRKWDSVRAEKRFHIWKNTKKEIGKCWNEEFVQKTEKELNEKRLLKENQWILKLRMAEIQCRLVAEGLISVISCEFRVQSVFEYRWQYALWEKESKFIWKFPSHEVEEWLLAIFHCVAFYLGKVSEEKDYRDIQNIVLAGESNIFAGEDAGILGHCLVDWFEKEKAEPALESEGEAEEVRTRISLLALLNLLEDCVKAEIIDKLPHYQKYMFHTERETLKNCMPVAPGVGYPGIIAETESKSNGSSVIKRVDFVSSVKVNSENWKTEEEKEYAPFSMALEKGFASLDTLFSENNEDELQISLILSIYQSLYKEIQQIQQNNPKQSIVLSRKNVFVKKEDASEDYTLLLCFYLLPGNQTGNGVLLDGRTGRFAYKTLHEAGSQYWIAGYLVKDVCDFDALRLKYENNEISEKPADEVRMMGYTFRRLTGESVNNGNPVKNIRSYKASVDRAIRRTKCFLSLKEHRDIFLEENAVIDSFINQRMGRERYNYRPAECSYWVAVWAKGYLRSRFDALMKLTEKEEERNKNEHPTNRRVPKSYLVLADYIEGLAGMVSRDMKSKEDFQGLLALAYGLRADAVLLQLRMQVLEMMESFSLDEREGMKKRKDDLPFAVLELDENQELTVDASPIDEIIDCLLDGRNDKRISRINHIGWLLLLEWVLEFVRFESEEEMGSFSGEIKKWVYKILKDTFDTEKEEQELVDTEKEEQEFPFENMNPFFHLWTCEQTDRFFDFCKKIDDKLGIKVEVRHSDFYFQKRGKIHILLDNQHLEKPEYFLTYSKLDNGLVNIEQEEEHPEKKIFSQSIRNGRTVGISVVEIRLGKMLQRTDYQELPLEQEENGEKRIANGDALRENEELAEQREEKLESERSDISEEKEGKVADESVKSGENDSEKVENHNTKDFLKKIKSYQIRSWKQRRRNIVNFDRIALFQFQTDSSYYHPETERCKIKKRKGELGYSCKEFRRRKLLKEVLDICRDLDVEILLLPEYSLRPETVKFLWDQVKDEKNRYQFSIWAGTFRIPYDYQFSKEPFEYLVGKNIFFHAAVLPVIMPEAERVFCSRIKKYPSIPLKEDINPCAAMDDNFEPIAKQHTKLEKGGQEKGRQEYGDARDHVTELICAELFALSSPGNQLSFADESFQLFRNYTSKDIEFGEYKERMLKDIQKYGEAISIYREKEQEKRRPILLVPACTTRAADYYILGQANYLGSGTNMVFCNGSGKLAKGGSCFIGQNSWDDEKGRRKKGIEKEVANIYHGVFPGIYMQTSDMPGRGGLGQDEQALLVCDLFPDFDKRQPNPESMKQSLELVAHIPILEEDVYCDECIKDCLHKEKNFFCQKIQGQQREAREKSLELMKQIYESLEQYKIGPLDKNPSQIAGSLIELGEKYHSDWLKERGKRYWEGNKLFPRRGLPETALDWRYIEIDYQEFMASDEYYLAIPRKDNSETENSMSEKGKERDTL